MAGFFKKFVDKVAGYSEDYDDDYDEGVDYQQEDNFSGFSPYGKNPEPAYFDRGDERRQYAPPPREAPHSQEATMGPQQPKVVPLRNTSGDHQLVFIQPDSIKTAQSVCDHVRSGHTVICNIENVDARIAQRVIDFISGAAHALDGNVKPIDAKAHSFVAAPKNVSLVDKKVPERKYTQEYSAPYRSQFG